MSKRKVTRAFTGFFACLLLAAFAGLFADRYCAVFADAMESGALAHSLFAQSAARILAREFPDGSISFLLMDARTGALLASRWPGASQPIPLGSLVKPFAALAYAQRHEYRYPIFVCRGAASGCWQARPHGRLNVSSALAHSCNSYFRDLTSHLTGAEMQDVTFRFGLDLPDPRWTGPPLMGLGDRWRIAPLRMARAYVELIRRRDQSGVREILTGLRESAQWGTGSAVGSLLKREDIFAKTGTAACTHTPRAPGDGFAVVAIPSDEPQLLLMVRVHGVPGSRAALTAAEMLRSLRD